MTALPPDTVVTTEPLPLPESLLPVLPRRRGVSRRMVFWRYAGLLGGIFPGTGDTGVTVRQQRLIRNISDHLALYHHLTGTPVAPETRTATSGADSALLDDWQRRGEPLRYRLGLRHRIDPTCRPPSPPRHPRKRLSTHTPGTDVLGSLDPPDRDNLRQVQVNAAAVALATVNFVKAYAKGLVPQITHP